MLEHSPSEEAPPTIGSQSLHHSSYLLDRVTKAANHTGGAHTKCLGISQLSTHLVCTKAHSGAILLFRSRSDFIREYRLA